MGKKGFATIKIPTFRNRKSRSATYNAYKKNTYNINCEDKTAKSIVKTNSIEQKKVHKKKVSFGKALSKIKVPVIPYIKANKLILSFLFCVLLGIILGSLFINTQNETLTNNLEFLFNSNFEARVSQPQIYTFISSITSSFVFVLSVLLMGMSLWGVFLIPPVLLFRGIGIGISSGFLFYAYSFKGLLFSLVVVLPGLLVSCIALLLVSREATYFSTALLKAQVKNTRMPSAKTYLMQNLNVFILIVVSALMDVFFSWCFSGVFVFQ